MSTRFVWFEYITGDAPKAQGFFGELFGWAVRKVPMPDGDYAMIADGDTTIGGYRAPSAPQPAHWLSHLAVANATESAARAKGLGGRILREAFKVGDHGVMAVVADPQGAALALWQPLAPGEPPAHGVHRFGWTELATPSPEAAVAFYSKLGNLTSMARDMGKHGTYHVLQDGADMVAGIMASPMPETPAAWLPYVTVASCDATADRAKRLGATIVQPPTDIPDVGRFAIFVDPQGAALGILQPR